MSKKPFASPTSSNLVVVCILQVSCKALLNNIPCVLSLIWSPPPVKLTSLRERTSTYSLLTFAAWLVIWAFWNILEVRKPRPRRNSSPGRRASSTETGLYVSPCCARRVLSLVRWRHLSKLSRWNNCKDFYSYNDFWKIRAMTNYSIDFRLHPPTIRSRRFFLHRSWHGELATFTWNLKHLNLDLEPFLGTSEGSNISVAQNPVEEPKL